jgi:hypothetical protein
VPVIGRCSRNLLETSSDSRASLLEVIGGLLHRRLARCGPPSEINLGSSLQGSGRPRPGAYCRWGRGLGPWWARAELGQHVAGHADSLSRAVVFVGRGGSSPHQGRLLGERGVLALTADALQIPTSPRLDHSGTLLNGSSSSSRTRQYQGPAPPTSVPRTKRRGCGP